MGHDLAKPLALTRLAFGVGTWLAPRAALSVTSLDRTAPGSPYLLRLFAAREAVLGAATLLSDEPPELLLTLGLVVDSLDAAAGVSAVRSGSLGKAAGILTSVAAAGVAIGSIALVQARRRT